MGQRLKFSGTAKERERGFKNWDIPTNSQAIASETERGLRAMRDHAQQVKENRNAVLAGMKENQRVSAAIRDQKWDMEEEFADAYHEAEMQHYKQRMADVSPGGGEYIGRMAAAKASDSKKANEKKAVQDLIQIAPKIATFVGGQIQEHNNRLQEEGQLMAATRLLTPLELAAIQNGDRQVAWVDAALKKVEWRLRDASAEERQAILGLSGQRLLGAQKYAIATASDSPYKIWLAKNSQNDDLTPGVGSIYDHEIGAEGTTYSTGRVLRAKLQKEFIATHFGSRDKDGKLTLHYDPKFIAAHATPLLQKIDDAWLAEQELRNTKQVEAEQKTIAETTLKSFIKGYAGANRGQAIADWLNHETANGTIPNRARKRDQVFDILGRMATSGELKRHEWADIRNGLVVLGDPTKGGPEQRVDKVWADQVGKVERAFEARDQLWAEQREDTRKAFDAQMKNEVAKAKLEMNRNLTKFDLERIESMYHANGYITPQWVLRQKNATEQSIEDSKYNLDALVASPEGLTMNELHSGRYHGSLLKSYEKHAINGPGSIGPEARKEYLGAVSRAVTTKVNGFLVRRDLAGAQAKIQTARAYTILQNRVREGLITGIYTNSTKAWKEETNQIRKEIDKGEGIFAPVMRGGAEVVGEDGGFADLQDPLNYDRKGAKYRQKAVDDKEFIWRKGKFSAEEIQQLEDIRSGKEIPNWAYQISNAYPSKDVIDVANAILTTAGKPELERRGLARIKDYTHPAMRRLITRMGNSSSRTNRAILGTQRLLGQEPNDQPILDLYKSKAVIEADPSGGYDAVTTARGLTTSTLNYNKPLTEFTNGEILSLMRKEGLKAGAFQLDYNTFLYYENKGWINPNEKFTLEVQNRIQRWELQRRSGEFSTQTDDGRIISIPNLGQNTSDWGPNDDVTDAKIKTALSSATFINPELLKDGLFNNVTIGVA